MPDEKKTEEELRHDIRRKFGFSEERDKERIDGFLEMQKDRYTATQQKKKTKEELEKLKGSGDPKTGQAGGEQPGGYSLKEIRALNSVHDDDVEKVTDYAKRFGLRVDEALKDEDLKAILARRDEERKSSSAVNTKDKKRGDSKIDGAKLLEQAEKTGKIPDSDEEIQAMVDARYKV
jgi:hypothetical protein